MSLILMGYLSVKLFLGVLGVLGGSISYPSELMTQKRIGRAEALPILNKT
jgi:hypothetical protein